MKPVRMAIVSAERPVCSVAENAARTRNLSVWLESAGISASPACGMYAGVAEASFICACPRDAELAVILEIADYFQQESVLVIDETRDARLVYLDGRPDVELGRMREVSRERAEAAGAYTRVGDVYFLAGDVAPAAATLGEVAT